MSDKKPKRYSPYSTLPMPSKPMNKVNYERRARREEADLVYGSLHQWTKRQPCILATHGEHRCGFYPERPGIESHHVKSIGSGGEDENNTLSLCPDAHDEFHRRGLTQMCERYGWDFRSLACEVTEQYVRESGSEES